MNRLLSISLLVLCLIAGGFWLVLSNPDKQNDEPMTLTRALGSEDLQFARAYQPRTFKFPEDHGAHPEYKTEWWYITGNVETPQGRAFGYQVTFFRIGLAATPPDIESKWASNQIYMAHAALTDISQQQFFTRERFARSALDLAGARTDPDVKVWLGDWTLQGSNGQLLPMTLTIEDIDFALALNLTTQKKLVLQGEDGLSQKGPEPGNASYYYSFTRLHTDDTLRVGSESVSVSGNSWLDREWSTSMLPDGIEGWDWFSIQLDNQTELMFYRLRTLAGDASALSKGSLVTFDSQKINLTADQVVATPLRWWRSPTSGVSYPVAWTLIIPSQALELQIEAQLLNQELNHSVRYWEGAITITGKASQQPITGKGYLELAGYSQPAN